MSLAEFRALLDSGRRLKIKFGTDITASFLHIGHAVNLWMMREMQERGHLVQFLIGDFTTSVGDPTERLNARMPPSREAIERDAAALIRQIGRVLITEDPSVFEVRRNSEWWDRMPLREFVGLTGGVSAGKLLSRDMFRARAESGGDIRVDEMLYPILQGWDSVMLESDLTIVGSDQLFNESMGRTFQERKGQKPQVVITTRITPGLDGVRKQSKTLGNFIAIDDDPRSKFGKAMSLPDNLVKEWLEVYTTMPIAEIDELCGSTGEILKDPRTAKLVLATTLVERWHSPEAAETERSWFERTFSQREFPIDCPKVALPAGSYRALALVSHIAPEYSRTELRRLIADGAVIVDGNKIDRPDTELRIAPEFELELRLGRRLFYRVVTETITIK